MAKDFYILGAGGFAKEVYALFLDCQLSAFRFKGFVDAVDQPGFLALGQARLPVVPECQFDALAKSAPVAAALGVGNPKLLDKFAQKYRSLVEFPNLIHPSVVYHRDSVTMQIGNVVTAGCILTCAIQLGSFNILNLSTTIGHDCVIGDANVFNPGVHISGGVNIGNRCLVGTNAAVLQNLKVSGDVTIGAAGLLTKDASKAGVYVGVPSKLLER